MVSKNIRPHRHLYVPTKKFRVSFLRTWTQLIAGAGACAIFSKLYGENMKLQLWRYVFKWRWDTMMARRVQMLLAMITNHKHMYVNKL